MELLAPAKDLTALKAAFDAGADAIYLGLKDFSARKRATNFSFEQLYLANEYKKSINKKIYVALNTLIFESDIKNLFEALYFLQDIGVDALIIQDFGLFNIIKKFGFNFKLHSSTQMGTKNHKQAEFLKNIGFDRIILERQLTFDEIKSIKEKSKADLEVFIHGAICYSLSGCCFFSQKLTNRSGNRGECAQPCRWSYVDSNSVSSMPFSTKDLEGFSYLSKLKKIGVNSLKIEGRMKSAEYVHDVVICYRKALDILDKQELTSKDIENLKKDLTNQTLSRTSCIGFFDFKKDNLSEIINSSESSTGIYIGKIGNVLKKSIFFAPSVGLQVGDVVRIHDLKTDKRFKLPIKAIYNNNTKVIKSAKGVRIGIPSEIKDMKAGAKIYLVERRSNLKLQIPKMDLAMKKFDYSKQVEKAVNSYYEMFKSSNNQSEIIKLIFSPEKAVYEINHKKWVFVSPDIYEADVSKYNELLNKKADGYLISHPSELNIFGQNVCAGTFYLYAVNKSAIDFFNSLGIFVFSKPVDIPAKDFAKIKNFAKLWIEWENAPLFVSRLSPKRSNYTLKTDKKIKIRVNNNFGILDT